MLLSLGLVGLRAEPIHTPYAKSEKLAIGHVTFPPEAAKYGLEELHVELSATYDNPFDETDVSLDATLTGPSGKSIHVPGFFYQAYTRSLKDGNEVDTPDGNPEWRIRLCPLESGPNKVTLTAKDRTGTITFPPFSFNAKDSPDPGFVRVSAKDHHYFAFDDGKSFFPIGANICWGNGPGTFSYDSWLPDFAKNGANYGRLWLSPSYVTFGLNQTGRPEEGKGMGQFDLRAAWRLDYVLHEARDNGIYMMLATESYNILREKDAYPYWAKTPENSDNGGPLRIWTQFWTDPRMDRLYRSELRYLVARYGWDTHVMAWEFWNEVDNVSDFDLDAVREWHSRMAAALKTLDPYQHLRTTSFSDAAGEKTIDQLSDLDYVQTHAYGGPDVVGTTIYEQTRKSEDGKPHYVGEVGADSGGPLADLDTKGQQVHDPMWAAVATGGSGGAMSWWWDNLIAPNKLYALYKPFADFVAGVDFPAEAFRQTDAHVRYLVKPEHPPKQDLVMEGGPVSWQPSTANQPHQITINGKGASGQVPLPGILHGIQNHPDLHNPIAIRFDIQAATTFTVEVGDVSGYGGANLVVKLDGEPALKRDFPSPPFDSTHPPVQESMTKFAGNYDVPIPAGTHLLTIENEGADWFMCGFRLRNYFTRIGPPLRAYAILGERTALCWIRNEADTIRNVVKLKHKIEPTPPSVIGLQGLASGSWKSEVWDTWTGKIISTATERVGIDGNVAVKLPTIVQDVAVKLRRVGD